MTITLPRARVYGRPTPPVRRTPLPPFDRATTDPPTGAPLPVATTINGTIPPPWTPGYMRANLWGVTIPGLPLYQGGANGAARERLLTYMLDRYPPEWQAKALATYAVYGYEQFWLSIPDARDGGRVSLAQYLEMSQRVKNAGLLPCHFLRSKDYDGRNPDPRRIEPWMDALVAAGLCDEASFAWEASLFYDPQAFRATIDHDTQRWPSVRWGVHLQQQYAHFGFDGVPGAAKDFWEFCLARNAGRLLYQYRTDSPKWTAGMMQARGNDVSVRLVQGGTWGLSRSVSWVAFEIVAQLQFTNDTDGDGRLCDELIGDLKGLECLATPGPLPPSGFGNGCRRVDGSAL